jgi:hypothetical protein
MAKSDRKIIEKWLIRILFDKKYFLYFFSIDDVRTSHPMRHFLLFYIFSGFHDFIELRGVFK